MANPQPAENGLVQEVTPDSRYLETRGDIERCLKELRDHRSTLTIRVDGDPESYTCKLLDVVGDDFLIEDITPRTGLSAVRQAKKLSIAARTRGTFVFIEDARVSKADEERGIPFFHIPLPKTMLYHQRRRAARFRLPLRVTANGSSITLFGDANMTGRIIDISAGGCRAEFDLPVSASVANDQVIEECAITIPKLLEIHSEAVIRHHHENKHTNTLVCGIELTRMHVTDRRRLEHFIQTIAKSAETA